MKNNLSYEFALCIILILLFFILGFDSIFFIDPQGIHFMRQTDSLSFASQYYNNSLDFFNPKLYNLKNVDGRAACEFPITYYITSILYTIVGKKFFILKLLHLIIVYLGIFSIYKMANQILMDKFYSILICLLIFTSTVFNYYSFNYLPDAPALGFTLMGWSYYFLYYKNEKLKYVIICIMFFTTGSLIKVTYLINPLSVISLSLISLVFKNNILTKYQAKKILYLGLIGVSCVLLWNIFILNYNSKYDSNSFITQALPIWNLSKENILMVWDYMSNNWYSKYFAHSSFHFLMILILFQIIFVKKSDKKLLLLTGILMLGNFAYFILFYSQFKDHDYYFITFLPLIILILISGIKTLQNFINKQIIHYLIKSTLFIIIIIGVNYSRIKLTERKNLAYNEYSKTGLLVKENLKQIDNLKLPKDSKFVIAPDLCPNGGLLFLDRMGWNINTTEEITSDNINHFKNLGADYLLLATNNQEILNLGNSLGNLILKGNGMSIYQLEKSVEIK